MDLQSTYTGNASAAVGGTTSFVGSVIGHDDPTLLHANIQECYSSGNNDSATLGSFLTEVTSDDIRDSSHTSRGGVSERQSPRNTISNPEVLVQALSELDKTQHEWKMRHEEEEEQHSSQHTSGREMDSTGDFYLEEVGGIYQSTPKRKISLHEQTILEEDEYFEESSREPSVAGTPPSDQRDKDMFERANAREAVIAAGAAGAGVTAFGTVMGSSSVDSSVADSLPSDLVYEYPSTEESGGRRTPSECARGVNSPSGRQIEEESTHTEERSVEDKEVVVHEVQNRMYNLSVNNTSTGTELEFLQRGIPLETERVEPSSDQRKRGFKSWIPVYDDSERSRSWFGNSKGLAGKTDELEAEEVLVDDGYRKRRRKLCLLNICLILLVIAAIICSVLLTLTFLNKGEATERDGVVASPTTAPGSTPTEERPTFNLMPPNTAPTNMPALSDAMTLSPTLMPSEEEEESGGENPSSGETTEEPNFSLGNPNTLSPSMTSAPGNGLEDDVDSNVSTPALTEAPTSATVTGRDDVDSNSDPPSPTKASQTPNESAEGIIANVSGDAIYDPQTPQYAAFDWLQNGDPAKLDLDSLADQELTQRYVAALLYFSMNGDSWVDKYRFLDESHVCEWNNGSPRNQLGIICDVPSATDGSEHGPITGIVLSKYKQHHSGISIIN